MFVDHRIYFHDFEAQHASVVGNDFHGQVCFAIRGAATHRRAHAGRIFGVDPVHVARNMVAGGAASGHAQSFFHHGAHATLVDVAHGEDADAGPAHVFFFDRVDVADTH